MDKRFSDRQSTVYHLLDTDPVYLITRLSTKHLDNVLIVRYVDNRFSQLEACKSFGQRSMYFTIQLRVREVSGEMVESDFDEKRCWQGNFLKAKNLGYKFWKLWINFTKKKRLENYFSKFRSVTWSIKISS